MASRGDSNPPSPVPGDPSKDIFEPKQTPKVVRVLTVLAYVLSVSMAAILLSIYYIFMWVPRPHIGARKGGTFEYLIANYSAINGTENYTHFYGDNEENVTEIYQNFQNTSYENFTRKTV